MVHMCIHIRSPSRNEVGQQRSQLITDAGGAPEICIKVHMSNYAIVIFFNQNVLANILKQSIFNRSRISVRKLVRPIGSKNLHIRICNVIVTGMVVHTSTWARSWRSSSPKSGKWGRSSTPNSKNYVNFNKNRRFWQKGPLIHLFPEWFI